MAASRLAKTLREMTHGPRYWPLSRASGARLTSFEMALREREATSTPQMIRATANLTCPYACSVVRDNGGQTTVEAGEITGMSAV